MAAKTYQQFECVETSAPSRATMLVWVESPLPKLNSIVTFKETGDRQWRVKAAYGTEVTGMNRGWGLNLPKSQRTER